MRSSWPCAASHRSSGSASCCGKCTQRDADRNLDGLVVSADEDAEGDVSRKQTTMQVIVTHDWAHHACMWCTAKGIPMVAYSHCYSRLSRSVTPSAPQILFAFLHLN